MSWFGWWRKKKVKAPNEIAMPKPQPTNNHSAEAAKQSEKKLKDAIRTKKEVSQVLRVNDQFAEALQRAMRRSHG